MKENSFTKRCNLFLYSAACLILSAAHSASAQPRITVHTVPQVNDIVYYPLDTSRTQATSNKTLRIFRPSTKRILPFISGDPDGLPYSNYPITGHLVTLNEAARSIYIATDAIRAYGYNTAGLKDPKMIIPSRPRVTALRSDPSTGMIFWTEWVFAGEKMGIYSANADGSSRRMIYTASSAARRIIDFASDVKSGRFWWVENTVGYSNFDVFQMNPLLGAITATKIATVTTDGKATSIVYAAGLNKLFLMALIKTNSLRSIFIATELYELPLTSRTPKKLYSVPSREHDMIAFSKLFQSIVYASNSVALFNLQSGKSSWLRDEVGPYGPNTSLGEYGDIVGVIPPQECIPGLKHTNERLSVDVDDDGIVCATDVSLIINNINANGSRKLEPKTAATCIYLDADGDGSVSSGDVMRVTSYINAH